MTLLPVCERSILVRTSVRGCDVFTPEQVVVAPEGIDRLVTDAVDCRRRRSAVTKFASWGPKMDEVTRGGLNSGRESLLARTAQSPFAGFVPWIIFWVVAGSPSTWEYGAIGAALAAIILAIPWTTHRSVKMLDVATI